MCIRDRLKVFWRQAVVFWAWEGLKGLIQWSAEVSGVHVTLELPSCWLSCCHWDCYSLFILIQIAKPWQNQMQKLAKLNVMQAAQWWDPWNGCRSQSISPSESGESSPVRYSVAHSFHSFVGLWLRETFHQTTPLPASNSGLIENCGACKFIS